MTAMLELQCPLARTWSVTAARIAAELTDAAPGFQARYRIHDSTGDLAAVIEVSALPGDRLTAAPMLPGVTAGTATPAPYLAAIGPRMAAADRLHTALLRSHKSIIGQG